MNEPADHTASHSLPEVHSSVHVKKEFGLFRRLFAFAGPAYLVSVGYMDPGNWATDLEGGARFGYQLIWVLLMSNLIAVLLQTLSARLGIVTGRDLAQACREHYPRPVSYALWVLCEFAIAACDLAELLGTAIGLNLLFGLPMIYGVLLTGFDTILFLAVQNFGIRKMEAFILVFVTTIGVCFGIEVFLAQPHWGEVMSGFTPHLTSANLYIAIGIIGATVMPHNLYLHSALVQTRTVEQTVEGKRTACRFNLIDSAVALNAAFFVNAAILVLAASVFYERHIIVTEIKQAYETLTPLLGTTVASTLFAVALISAGQSSTLTGTLAGQIVMEGFLHFKIRPWVRRLITRLLAIVPAMIVIGVNGESGSYALLILSQVILSLQLPFAVIPLVRFTSDKAVMGSFASKRWVQWLAWLCVAIIVALNVMLIVSTLGGWITASGAYAGIVWVTVMPIAAGLCLLLIYIWIPPAWRVWKKPAPRVEPVVTIVDEKYERIGVALDFGVMDGKVLSHARTLAKLHKAEIILFHIVEGVSGQLFGEEANDDEARRDKERLDWLSTKLRNDGLDAQAILGFGYVPRELVRLSNEHKVDVLVMGGHGHRGLKDVLFGASISEVRHSLNVPVLVVQ